mmetsp:Transcript_4060/g.10375  ORF Transcript_4060/g.10375 Transcript_4060/m.10375 type:complete len:205 (-) Transcript_4060:907-1521(-)
MLSLTEFWRGWYFCNSSLNSFSSDISFEDMSLGKTLSLNFISFSFSSRLVLSPAQFSSSIRVLLSPFTTSFGSGPTDIIGFLSIGASLDILSNPKRDMSSLPPGLPVEDKRFVTLRSLCSAAESFDLNSAMLSRRSIVSDADIGTTHLSFHCSLMASSSFDSASKSLSAVLSMSIPTPRMLCKSLANSWQCWVPPDLLKSLTLE